MKTLALLSAIVCSMAFVSCNSLSPIHPSGTKVDKVYSVRSVKSISIESGFTALIEQDSVTSLEIEMDESYRPYIQVIEDEDGEVTIRREQGTRFSNNKLVKIHLKVPYLEEIEVSGGGELTAAHLSGKGDLSIDMSGGSQAEIFECYHRGLDLSVSGGGSVVIRSGEVDQFELELSGGSRVEAFGLLSKYVDAELSGGSKSQVSVSETVELAASGGSLFQYKGGPTFRKLSLSGGSKSEQK